MKHDDDDDEFYLNESGIVLWFRFLMNILALIFCRGNTPFCSKECREEQIEFDEAKEKNWKLSSKSGVRQSETNQNSTSDKTLRTGTVAVA